MKTGFTLLEATVRGRVLPVVLVLVAGSWVLQIPLLASTRSLQSVLGCRTVRSLAVLPDH